MIYDAHSHFEINAFHILPSIIERYFSLTKRLCIEKFNASTLPIYTDSSRTIIKPLIWKFENNSFHHYGVEENRENVFLNYSLNPYSEINDLLRRNMVDQSKDLKLNFIPLIHPIYDETNYIKSLLDLNPHILKFMVLHLEFFQSKQVLIY